LSFVPHSILVDVPALEFTKNYFLPTLILRWGFLNPESPVNIKENVFLDVSLKPTEK